MQSTYFALEWNSGISWFSFTFNWDMKRFGITRCRTCRVGAYFLIQVWILKHANRHVRLSYSEITWGSKTCLVCRRFRKPALERLKYVWLSSLQQRPEVQKSGLLQQLETWLPGGLIGKSSDILEPLSGTNMGVATTHTFSKYKKSTLSKISNQEKFY